MDLCTTIYIIVALVVSCAFAAVMMPNILVVSFKKRLFDVPDERKVHTDIVPRLGGVAFAPIIIFTLSMLVAMTYLGFDAGHGLKANNVPIFMMGLGSLILLYLTGLKDDLVGVSFRVKFVVQIMCGTLMVISGLKVDNLYGFLFMEHLHPVIGYLTTIFLVVFIVNAVNLIDGIDGLASGLSMLALIYYGFSFALSGNVLCAMLAFVTMGTLIPFFYYNVFGRASHCRKIFMGDTGALTVGYILAFLGIKMLSMEGMQDGHNVVKAFAPLIVPCFDVVRVALYRVMHGNHPFKPDRNHIHHKFLALGLSHRWSMVTILVVSLFFTYVSVCFSNVVNVNLLVLIVLLVWMAMNYTLNRMRRTDK